MGIAQGDLPPPTRPVRPLPLLDRIRLLDPPPRHPAAHSPGAWAYLPDGEGLRPLVLFLHGAGERGADLNAVLRHGLPRRIADGWRPPFAMLAPQCPADRWWDPDPLARLLDAALARLPVDPARVYLTGLSMGGFGAWALATRYPERFAALVPVCGGGLPFFASRLRDVPVWAFHGARDEVVPLHYTTDMVEAVRCAGGEARLSVYPEAGHDAWTAAYDDEALWAWMLAQQRRPPNATAP